VDVLKKLYSGTFDRFTALFPYILQGHFKGILLFPLKYRKEPLDKVLEAHLPTDLIQN
jgi:hypothetical protein